jgi:hypothetical protein
MENDRLTLVKVRRLDGGEPKYVEAFRDRPGLPAGEKAASGWPPHAMRVRPPAPYTDWTEAAQAGIDLRGWWIENVPRPLPNVAGAGR